MNAHWRAALRLATLQLAIAPEAFWRLSLVEWRALTEVPVQNIMPRSELAALLERFPDELL
jgi:uncharacterized phage protein (TIGR02216 family)